MIKILVLGGGFGGIRTALDLEKKFSKKSGEVEISLIDKNSYHLFTPLLYEVASVCGIAKDPFSVKLKKTISVPFGDIFGGENINFIQAEISKINLADRSVITGGGEAIKFDYLVLALGGQTADFGVNGVKEYACQFKNLEDALLVNQKIEEIIKKVADNTKQSPVEILICGGGFTGVELAAELAGHVKKIAKQCHIKGGLERARIKLFEAGPKILPMIPDKEREKISNRLTRLGVAIMENSAIEEVGADFVKLKNGQTIHGDLVIWTAGVKANEILTTMDGLLLTEKGKAIVDDSLAAKGFQNIFAVGDIMEFIDPKTQKPVPAQAYTAIDQGKIVARNILNEIRKSPLRLYKPFSGVWVSPVGGKFAVAYLSKSLVLGGLFGWIARQVVDLRYFLSILPVKKALALFWEEITLFTKND